MVVTAVLVLDGLKEEWIDKAHGATGMPPLQIKGRWGDLGPESWWSTVTVSPRVSPLGSTDLPVPVGPLGAESPAQRATGSGRSVALTAKGRVPEAFLSARFFLSSCR